MIFFDDKRKDVSTGFVENNPETAVHLPEATRRKILNSTVRLFAATYDPKNDEYPDVYATGVIFNVQGNTVQVLTALHNILVWKRLTVPPDDPAELLSDFAAKLTVYYGDGDMTFNAQAAAKKCQNNAVTIPALENACAECASKMKSPCYYDLALISCTKSEFATYATNFVLGANYQFQNQVAGLINGAEAVLKGKYACVQLGYGNTEEIRTKLIYNNNTKKMVRPLLPQSDEDKAEGKKPVPEPPVKKISQPPSNEMTKYHLHYRVTGLKDVASTCAFNQEAEAGSPPAYVMFPHAYFLKTTGGTSAPGDSGGPLYIIDTTNMNNVYLLGVTTGSDMEAAEVPATGLFYNDISTSVLPYFKL